MRETPASRRTTVRINRLVLRLARNWLKIVTLALAVYVTLPVAAPTLMRLGAVGPASLIYTVYSPFCHQFAFRSFFLYGDQPVYPRAIAGTALAPFEDYAVNSPGFRAAFSAYSGIPADQVALADLLPFSPALQFAARDFRGDAPMGYKATLCERDIAIYLALLTGALVFARVRTRLRPIPVWLYVILGLAPVGLDGLSQMLGYPPFSLWPAREALPAFRIVTGALFGLASAWLAFPYMEISMQETRQEIEYKLRQAGIHV
ncbi:MAG: hypothetical protein BroJett033_6020 [Chloroflexota bacterium]|nr:MAG: hypothetical protein BroJett033_6020 [Chloroflexota bacterium]